MNQPRARLLSRLAGLAVAAALLSLLAVARAENLEWSSGSPGGSWFTIVTGLSNVLMEKNPDLAIRIVPGGGRDNPSKIQGGISQLGMGIERQMVGIEVDVMRQQQRQTLFHPADDRAIVAAVPATPEQPMVNKNGVGLRRDGRFNQRQTGRDAGDDFAHLGLAFDLQAVRSMVLEALRLQQLIESGQQQRTRRDRQGGTQGKPPSAGR